VSLFTASSKASDASRLSGSKKEPVLLHQIVRIQYLRRSVFQMLADETLPSTDWKKIRAYAKEKIKFFADSAVAELRPSVESNARQ
jgi:hypothetical protein